MSKGFNYDPSGGDKYIGKVIQAREATVLDWDELREATMSKSMGETAEIFLLEIDDLAGNPAKHRAYFMSPDTSGVSKWTRFKSSLAKLEIRITRNDDGRTDLEGKYFELEERPVKMGKHGDQTVLEVVRVPAPEEVEALERARGDIPEEAPPAVEVKGAPAPANTGAEAPLTDKEKENLKGLFLMTCEGLTLAETGKALKDVGVDARELAYCTKLVPELIVTKAVSLKDKKFVVPA